MFAVGIEDARVEPAMLLDLPNEITLRRIEFVSRDGQGGAHLRLIARKHPQATNESDEPPSDGTGRSGSGLGPGFRRGAATAPLSPRPAPPCGTAKRTRATAAPRRR